MLIGLDVSTSVCGWCMLSPKGAPQAMGALVFEGATLYDRLEEFRLLYKTLKGVTYVAIEQALKRHPKSSAHTIALLQRFNGMVSACAMFDKRLKQPPLLINSETARKTLGIVVPKTSERGGKTTKKIVLEQVQKRHEHPILFNLNRNGNPCDYCYDAADAYVIAMAGHEQIQRQVKGSSR